MSGRRGPLVTVALAALALIVGAVALLAGSGPTVRRSGAVPPDAFVVTLEPGTRRCQDGVVPAGADRVRLTLGTFGRPGVVGVDGERAGVQAVSGGSRVSDGVVTVPLRPVASSSRVLRLCVANRGQGRVAIAGRGSVLSLVFPESGVSWIDRAGDLARAVGRGRLAPGGPALAWLALGLAVLAGAGGVILVLWSSDGE